MIKDDIVKGLIAGIAGAVCQNLYALGTRVLGYQGPLYVDYGKILLFYSSRRGWLPDILGLIAHFIWDIILAVFFVYFIKYTSSRHRLLKGIVWALAVWFFIKTGATLYKIPVIIHVEPVTVVVFLIGSIIYGLALVLALNRMEQGVSDDTRTESKQR